ncbi:MAG: hypothetical protein KIT02_12230 [Devosia sp.]|uniref:ImuA family protein n=1 Tax=Devosia sp. TaxID=1871048 RepID=UPI0024C5A937|nr:hypothetical protein [Devosia sp.]UYN98703.1 MAG: hypothetical protein KIT02_12230 [Devosia sp.]
MQTPDHPQRLAALRTVIADIERKPALAEARARVTAGDNDFPVLGGGLVQEVFADDPRDGGASLGFALAQARSLVAARRPAIFYLQLGEEAQKLAMPYGPGLSWFGVDPAQLVIIRVADMTEFLWAAEEVLSCRAVAGLVADVRGEPRLLNFTASRRLSLRAASSDVSLFLLRYGHGRVSSAGHLRWHVRPERSGRAPYDERAPGAARWRLHLEKGRIAGNRTEWVLEWTKNGFAVIPQSAPSRRQHAGAPLPGAVPAILGHRLSQAG